MTLLEASIGVRDPLLRRGGDNTAFPENADKFKGASADPNPEPGCTGFQKESSDSGACSEKMVAQHLPPTVGS